MTLQLLEFLHGRASLAELPDTLELPAALWQYMNQLWQKSVSEIEQGIVQEWGGLLVLDEQVGLKLVNIVSGEALPLRLQFSGQEDFVGTFHTHPRLDGLVTGFSPTDFASFVNLGEQMSVVHSGKKVHMLLRSLETPTHLSEADATVYYQHLWSIHFENLLSYEDAFWYTFIDLCRELGVARYEGVASETLGEVYRP